MVAGDDSTITTQTGDNGLPLFTSQPFTQFIRDFKNWIRRHQNSNYVLNNPIKPVIDPPKSDETFAQMQYRENIFRDKLQKYEAGNASIASYLYTAVNNHNTTATNILIKHMDEVSSDGLKAIKVLEDHYKDKTVQTQFLNDLKIKYENRVIRHNETATRFVEEIDTLRLQLNNLGHEITDKDIINKIHNGLVSLENRNYADLYRQLILSPCNSLPRLINIIKRIDDKSYLLLPANSSSPSNLMNSSSSSSLNSE